MRDWEEVEGVKRLAAAGFSRRDIVRLTGIPYSTVGKWLTGVRRANPEQPPDLSSLPGAAYAYLCGLYLGDGHIASFARNVYKLQIHLDAAYPGIIRECAAAMAHVLPENRVHTYKRPSAEMYVVSSYSKHWPYLFPQHGEGRKHDRDILLDPWQGQVLERHIEPLLRGLIHSDGSRANNVVKGRSYPRYQFVNRSEHIRAIFSGACDELGVHWTRSNTWTISVSRRADVARLDTFIGPKA